MLNQLRPLKFANLGDALIELSIDKVMLQIKGYWILCILKLISALICKASSISSIALTGITRRQATKKVERILTSQILCDINSRVTFFKPKSNRFIDISHHVG